MPLTTHEIIASFGGVEDDQRYLRLVELFAEDAVYYDPFFGPQIGKPAIAEFMAKMEEVVPASGARFDQWHATAGHDCGYAQWVMIAPNADGVSVTVPGESLYRLRDGQVLGVVDYVDPVAYAKLRGDAARPADFVAGLGSLPSANTPVGPATAALRDHVAAMGRAGRWTGSAELIDHAGEETVGWAQWVFHGEHGDFAGWSLRNPEGHIRDLFDTVTAHDQATASGAVKR